MTEPSVHVIIDRQTKASVEGQSEADLKIVFSGLARKWREETGGSSLMMRRYAHSSYQAILVLGGRDKDVVKLILMELQDRPDMWFEALRRLTDEDPAKNAATFEDAVKSWLDWGIRKQLIS